MPDLKFKILMDFKGLATTVRMINESPCFCRHSLSVVFCGPVFINRYNTTVLWRLNLHYYYILPRRWQLFFGSLSWLEVGLGQMFWLPIPFSCHGSNTQIRKYEIWISRMFLSIRLLLTKSIATCKTCKTIVTIVIRSFGMSCCRDTDAQRSLSPLFSWESRNLVVGQTNWAFGVFSVKL